MARIVCILLLGAASYACDESGVQPVVVDAAPFDATSVIVGGPSGEPWDPDASTPEKVRSILRSCAGGPETQCHATNAGETTLSLDPDGGDLLRVRSSERPDLARIEPYDPQRSYLFLKLVGDGGIDGGRMPLGGPYDERVPGIFRDWIEAGAPLR